MWAFTLVDNDHMLELQQDAECYNSIDEGACE